MKSRTVLIILFSVVAVVLIGLGIMEGNLFKVKNIEIVCDDISEIDVDYIAQACGIKKDQSIFNINIDSTENAINSTGEFYAESVIVIYPSTVKITIIKRVPAAIIEYENSFIITDSSCNVIKNIANADEYDLLRFTGIRISQYQTGSSIVTKDEYQKSVAQNIMTTLIENNAYNIVSVVSLEDLSNIYIITKNGKRIDLCEAVDVSQKLQWLSEAELQNAIFDENEHTITLYSGYFVIK